jgi:hypothetical protein
MQKLMLTLLIGIIALAPAYVAAQVSSGAPGSTRPNSPLEGSGGPGAGPASGSGTSTGPGAASGPSGSGANTAPDASGHPAGSSSASPSQTADDFAKYTTPAECEKAGGVWLLAAKGCVRR